MTWRLASSRTSGVEVVRRSRVLMGTAVDIESRSPIIGNNQGGLSGPSIKPIALLKVHQVYQVTRPHGIPIIGQGGLTTANDAIEFLLAGRSAVRWSCCAVRWRVPFDIQTGKRGAGWPHSFQWCR